MKKKQLKIEKISIRLEPDLLKSLEKLAINSDKSLGNYIRSELKKIVSANKGLK